MKVRWLGNACLEVFGEEHIIIDPNMTVSPKKEPDLVLLTHEHDDHFDPDDYEKYCGDAPLYAPETTLKKFGVEGEAVEPGDRINAVEVLECDCYGSEESVSFFYNGLLHSGDSNVFPEIKGVDAVFTACFPDYYDDYVEAFHRLRPELVVPFHYDPKDDQDDATGLIERLDEEGITNRLLFPGESVDV